MRIRSNGKSRNAGKLGPAAILNQNPIFEMASNEKNERKRMRWIKEDYILRSC
jgi:hypothetical protein